MDQWRVAVLGDGGVGKTALAVQTYDHTIEDAYRKQMIVDQKLCFIETAGQGSSANCLPGKTKDQHNVRKVIDEALQDCGDDEALKKCVRACAESEEYKQGKCVPSNLLAALSEVMGIRSLSKCRFPSCGKVNVRTDRAKEHARVHIGNHPYKCTRIQSDGTQGCDARFSRKDDRNRHDHDWLGGGGTWIPRKLRSLNRMYDLSTHPKDGSPINLHDPQIPSWSHLISNPYAAGQNGFYVQDGEVYYNQPYPNRKMRWQEIHREGEEASSTPWIPTRADRFIGKIVVDSDNPSSFTYGNSKSSKGPDTWAKRPSVFEQSTHLPDGSSLARNDPHYPQYSSDPKEGWAPLHLMEVPDIVRPFSSDHRDRPVNTTHTFASSRKRRFIDLGGKTAALLSLLAVLPVGSCVTVRITRIPDIEDVHDSENDDGQARTWSLQDEGIYVVNKSDSSRPVHLDIVLRWHQTTFPIIERKEPDHPSPPTLNCTDIFPRALQNYSSTLVPAPTATTTPICITTSSAGSKASLDPVATAGIATVALVIGGFVLAYCFLPGLVARYRNGRVQHLAERYEPRNGGNIAGSLRAADLNVL